MRYLTLERVVTDLVAACNGNQARWAREHRLSPQYVGEVIKGQRHPGPAIEVALGLRRVVRWERVTNAIEVEP